LIRLGDVRFSQGRSTFADRVAGVDEVTAKIYVRVRFEKGRDVLAQLDTGAAWSVLDPAMLRFLGSSVDWLEPARLGTRFGSLKGHLVRTPVTFLADEGPSITLPGTFFVSEHWPSGLTFLGYSGLLDSIRFALDPQANDFYFGLPW
jgi:hypothetical protein